MIVWCLGWVVICVFYMNLIGLDLTCSCWFGFLFCVLF